MKKTIVGIAMSIAAIGLLAGCGGADSSPSGMATTSSAAPASGHNAADVTFVQGMIPHHRQALDMAKLAASRASSAQVKDLAGRIEKAQDPEIRLMSGWLTQWGVASTSSMPSSMPDMAHGPMPGMMSDADMRQLDEASGAEFDKMFLRMMTQHHQGAIDMAHTELAQGGNPDAKALAQRIADAQTAEINEMQQLLKTL